MSPFFRRRSSASQPLPEPQTLQITCSGTPHEIGLTHGIAAKPHIQRCISFYRALFLKKCNLTWTEAQTLALKFNPLLLKHYPHFVEEMQGVAKGAEVKYEDILALNVRTEIAFGSESDKVGFSDGCTVLSWNAERAEYGLLGQNWDWHLQLQAENLIVLKIEKDDGLIISMITEAGIIGKIGFNSDGVGVTLNAIKAPGISFNKLPVHLALRAVLEAASQPEATRRLTERGVAAACFILIADTESSVGLECSALDVVTIQGDDHRTVIHTNHYLEGHEGVKEDREWAATQWRLKRANALMGRVNDEEPEPAILERVFSDELGEKLENGEGTGICRRNTGDEIETLFSVVMELGRGRATLKIGKPSCPKWILTLTV